MRRVHVRRAPSISTPTVHSVPSRLIGSSVTARIEAGEVLDPARRCRSRPTCRAVAAGASGPSTVPSLAASRSPAS